MKKIVTIGGAAYDIFILYESADTLDLHMLEPHKNFLVLEEGSKVDVEDLKYHSGGGATNSAVSFKRLGNEVTSFFKIGNDEHGEFIVHDLEKAGVNVKHISIDPQTQTGTSFIFPTESGDRIVLVYRGANKQLHENDLPFDIIQQVDQLYITSLGGQAAYLLPKIAAFARQHNIPVATNPGTSQLTAGADYLRDALENIEILILNCSEASQCMASLMQTSPEPQGEILADSEHGKKSNTPLLLQEPITYQSMCFSIRSFFKEVLNRGPKIVAVTNGAEGVYVATGNKIYFHPSMPYSIVNTLGAGDAFGSCFVARLGNGASVEDALRAGIVNACSVISHLDAKAGLLEQAELMDRIKSTDPKLLQTFEL